MPWVPTLSSDRHSFGARFFEHGRDAFLVDGFQGLLVAWAQMTFGLIGLPGSENFLIDAYPVVIRWTDIILITGSATALCVLAAWYPAHRAAAIDPAVALRSEG